MFSIAAINDPDSRGQWEPLAPTKEAQVFRLTQIYQEGLLQLQAGEYSKAQGLFQSIIEDPMVVSAEEHNAGGNDMQQLRFLALKNLANVFAKQGSSFYEKAIQCYLQAVEIDGKDVTVWNKLGTVACAFGSLNIARMAFEQGLKCSPENWNCMEKLLEVLIAIGDDVSCLSLAQALLKKWPLHSRASFVKSVIEKAPSSCFEVRGTDKLEPRHIGLSFSKKRNNVEDDSDKGCSKKRKIQQMQLHLPQASWGALVNVLLETLRSNQASYDGSCNSSKENNNQDSLLEYCSIKFFLRDVEVSDMMSQDNLCRTPEHIVHRESERVKGNYLMEHSTGDRSDTLKENRTSMDFSKDLLPNAKLSEKTLVPREKEILTDEEPPQERRSTRLERLRTRKSEKEEFDTERGKEKAKHLRDMLNQYIVSDIGQITRRFSSNISSIGGPWTSKTSSNEKSDDSAVIQFLQKHSCKDGFSHIIDLILEKICSCSLADASDLYGLIELEKYTRPSNKSRSPFCSLFLAELSFDRVSSQTEESRNSDLIDDTTYYLCKVVEAVALVAPFPEAVNGSSAILSKNESYSTDHVNLGFGLVPSLKVQEPIKDNSALTIDWSFWVRFHWLSGRLWTCTGNKERGYKEFQRCLSILKNNQPNGNKKCVFLPYCKFEKEISSDIVEHELRVLNIEVLLRTTSAKLVESGNYSELITLLGPILCGDEKCFVKAWAASKDSPIETSVELDALDMLIAACEKVKPRDLSTLLKCHKRRLEILCVAAGIGEETQLPCNNGNFACELEQEDAKRVHWNRLISDEVKSISQYASKIKEEIDESDKTVPFDMPITLLAEIQLLLLNVMCYMIMTQTAFKPSVVVGSDCIEQLENNCFVDSAIAFCKLQHLDLRGSLKKQVELLALMHELLAEHGLCCAGKGCEGGEGAFLKVAIKHLLALEIKLKSSLAYETVVNVIKHDLNKLSESLLHKNLQSAVSVENQQYSVPEQSSKEENSAAEACLTKEIEPAAVSETVNEHTEVFSDNFVNVGGIKASPRDAQLSNSGQPEGTDIQLEVEKIKAELGMDNVLDQSFFCLYGLNLRCGLDSSSEDDLAVHKNTSLGDYQTKEQCADVFKYLLPYAKASSRTGLIKLRRVLRAIRKQFPHPPEEVLNGNAIDLFLDNPDFNEEEFCNMVISKENIRYIAEYAFQSAANATQVPKSERDLESYVISLVRGKDIDLSTEPCLEVYANLYHIVAQAEEMSATDKYSSYVLTKEGEEFVQQNANLFKFDLLYNPLRFESWQKLASIYDEEVDLMLNDGSRHMNVLEWKKQSNLNQRVETSRRRIRRSSLMSLALAKTSEQKSQMHELLALVYYDSLQNVVPLYDQRHSVPARDSVWSSLCQNSFKHFEKAFAHRPEWSHLFYMGKLSEKLGHPHEKALSHYSEAASMNVSAVDPVYRIHASRMKLLYNFGRHNYHSIKVVMNFCFHLETKEKVKAILASGCRESPVTPVKHGKMDTMEVLNLEEGTELFKKENLEEAWRLLFDDCIAALEVCLEGELKHFHKARYMLAQGLYYRGEGSDLEKAKEQLSFCFKSNRSAFTFNMWEIDGVVRKGRRKAPGVGGLRKGFELGLPESSRKFITCIRKYILLYLILCEKTGDFYTLERAYACIRSDKKFSTCLEDIAPLALMRFIQALGAAINLLETSPTSAGSSDQLLEKMFNVFMEHGNARCELSGTSEVSGSSSNEFSETTLYSFIHRYLYHLEIDSRIDVLETVNEKLRKRFKNPKLSNSYCSKVCKHAAVAWCRLLLTNLASVTPEPASITESAPQASESTTDSFLQLIIDIQVEQFLNTSFDDSKLSRVLERKLHPVLSSMRKVPVRKAAAQNTDKALIMLRHAYNFYKESPCVALPSGINLYALPSGMHSQGTFPSFANQEIASNVEALDLSTPRKLLVWAYSLVKGHYSTISAVIKYCEDNAKNPNLMTCTNT